jgi:glucokinase
VDISGGGERVVLCDLRGNVVSREDHLRPDDGPQQPDEVIDRAGAMMRGLLEGSGVKSREVLRIGVGFGGPVDARRGVVRLSHNSPGWEEFPLAGQIERLFDVPTLLDNDARLAALGEVWFGTGAGDSECHLVYVHWSIGVGGGIVASGKLVRGASTVAGEIGHTTVRTGPEALPCRCGGSGHLEAYIRSAALEERARQLIGTGEAVSVREIFDGAGGDPRMSGLVEEAVEMMASTVANLVTALNPNVVVIGGRVAREAASYIPRIEERARAYAMPLSAEVVEITPALLGEDSSVMGAVALGLDSLR